MPSSIIAANRSEEAVPGLPALPPPRPPLVPERSDFLEGDAPAADKVAGFLARALEATGNDADKIDGGAGALDLRRAAVEPLGQSLWPRLHWTSSGTCRRRG